MTCQNKNPEPQAPALAPGLYIVATPIGNLRDITLRALDTLKTADLVVCEDTRVTAKLLSHYGIAARTVAYNDHNAPRVRPKILGALKLGKTVALVSDAGTPLVSDPGYKLVGEAIAQDCAVFTVPGASSVTAALAIAGLPTDRFLFLGFLPTKAAGRQRVLREIAPVRTSLVVFEAPPRVREALADMAEILGGRQAAVTRELTKRFEEVRRGRLDGLAAHYAAAGPPKGEIVIVVGPPLDDQRQAVEPETLDQALTTALGAASLKAAVAEVSQALGLPRKRVYERALALKRAGEGTP